MIPDKSVNAWILPVEDEPPGTGYNSENSCFQSLIKYGVYKYVDMLNIAFVNIVRTSSNTWPPGNGSEYTIQIQPMSSQKPHPDGTNQDYMDWIMRDARQANPNIRILVTLNPEANEISQIFSGDSTEQQSAVTLFANNVAAYLKHYDLSGFDIDWEGSLTGTTEPDQMNDFLKALREEFDTQPGVYYLTLSPATTENLTGRILNETVDFINLQLYAHILLYEEFKILLDSVKLLAYGAKFEMDPRNHEPDENAWVAHRRYENMGFKITTQWRLNSGNFQFEQANQMILYQMVYGIPGTAFDDTPIIGAAGTPPITQMFIRSGEVLDAIQATNAGYPDVPYVLPLHGGTGGNHTTVYIPSSDVITEISGYTGIWHGWDCVVQITIKTRGKKTFGPFGTMKNTTRTTPFTHVAPQGQSIVAFSGSIVNTSPAAEPTVVIGSLKPSYA